MIISRWLSAGTALLMSSWLWVAPAHSQDVSWLGEFAGFQSGYTTNDIDLTGIDVSFLDDLDGLEGFIGGVHAGSHFYQQFGFVGGIVTDFNWTGANGNAFGTTSSTVSETTTIIVDECDDECFEERVINEVTETTTNLAISAEVDWKASIRSKFGFLVSPNLLVYSTSGIAFAQVSVRADQTQTITTTNSGTETSTTQQSSSASSDDVILMGFVIGGGFETKVTPDTNFFMQVLHYNFGDNDLQILGSNVDVELEETTVVAGFSFYFN